jgi:4-amino-4-deoxy-L-arabinose transferase-like glycosyltransferase
LLVAPVSLRTGNMFAIPSFEPLFRVGCALILVRIIQEDNPRLWPWLGVTCGLGLLTKHSMLFFVFGLKIGVLVTPLRRQFRTPWPWVAGAIVAIIFAPNIVWQVNHGWLTAEFLRDLNETVMAGVSKIQFVAGQFLYLNPLASFVWIWGLVFLMLLATDSKIYYLSPAYPPIIAAGGLAIERWAAGRERSAWLRPALLALPLLGGAAFAPAALPYLSIQNTDRYMAAATFGAMGNIYELTGDLHGMFG